MSKKLDIPVSVQADGETLSLALFWDVRILGTLKFFDHNTHQIAKALDLDQFFEVSVETSFSCEKLLNTPDKDGNVEA